MRLSWDKYFLSIAKLVAMRSGCNSRPTGAVIVKNKRIIATGYNGSLPGLPQCTDNGCNYCYRRDIQPNDTGENKYSSCESIHAEQNAINQIPYTGQGGSLIDAILYCTLEPCYFCLKNIASVGIKKIFYELSYESSDKKRDIFWKSKYKEYGIETVQLTLTKEESSIIASNMVNITSIRRLK